MRFSKLQFVFVLACMALGSCVRQANDMPPDTSQYDPYLPVNCTLAQLSAAGFNIAPGASRVMGDTTISGIVVADDRSGNIYKKLFIMDSSGAGFALVLDKTYLYGDYPVGRKVYVKLKGLVLFNYSGTPEIVSSVDALGNTVGIPSVLVPKYVIKASYPHTVTPKSVDAGELFSNPYPYVNTLVQLTGMQFDDASKNTLYSSPSVSTNRYVTNCEKTISLDMYNSSYALFAPAITPSGAGTIAGIITIYNGKPEMILRDTSDVRFLAPRCP